MGDAVFDAAFCSSAPANTASARSGYWWKVSVVCQLNSVGTLPTTHHGSRAPASPSGRDWFPLASGLLQLGTAAAEQHPPGPPPPPLLPLELQATSTTLCSTPQSQTFHCAPQDQGRSQVAAYPAPGSTGRSRTLVVATSVVPIPKTPPPREPSCDSTGSCGRTWCG